MGLYLEQKLETGVTVSYHRIVDMQVNYSNRYVVVAVGSYLNKESRDSGSIPVKLSQFHLSIEEFADADLRKAVYTAAVCDWLVGAVEL